MPLIVTSFLCVQILSAAREPVVAKVELPSWMTPLSLTFIIISIAMVLWVRSGKMPTKLSHPLATLAFILCGLKPIAFMQATLDPGPLYLAVVLLAGSLCFFSMRYLVTSMIVLVLCWLAVATQVLPTTTVLSALAIILLGGALSVVVLQRRIASAIALLALEQRVVTLESILPMCASCKQTRDHTGKWQSIEEYIEEHQAGTQVSHGSCPGCTEQMHANLEKHRTANASA